MDTFITLTQLHSTQYYIWIHTYLNLINTHTWIHSQFLMINTQIHRHLTPAHGYIFNFFRLSSTSHYHHMDTYIFTRC